MLQAAVRLDDDVSIDTPSSAVVAPVAAQPYYIERGARYGEARRFNLRAVALTVAIHALLIGGLFGLRYQADRKVEPKLISVNLMPSAPPPPAPAAEPQPHKATVQAPIPLIQTPRPAPPVATTPDPAPVTPPQPAAPPAPPAPPSVVQSSDLGARMVSGRPPRYPIESRRSGEQGTVVLALTVGTDGGVANIAVQRSSGFPRLDDAARGAVRTWRWAPILRDGVAVMVRGIVEIPFVLQGVPDGRHRGGGRHRRDGGGDGGPEA